jgi:hypothetical protein
VRSAVKKLDLVGAIERQRRSGQSDLCKVKHGWVPTDPGSNCRSKATGITTAPPAESAGDPGNVCRTPRQNLPHTPAESAAETDPKNQNHKPEPERTDQVPPPTASAKPLSSTTVEVIQEPTRESLAKRAEPVEGLSSKTSAPTNRFSPKGLTDAVADIDYHSPRLNPDEEALVVELATRFNQVQTVMGREKVAGVGWEKFLTGFRMILFSDKHRRSFEDVCVVLDYLSDNPTRAKEIVNKDKKRGVTNTYHLMFLFDRLLQEAMGSASEALATFSKRKVRVPDSVASS